MMGEGHKGWGLGGYRQTRCINVDRFYSAYVPSGGTAGAGAAAVAVAAVGAGAGAAAVVVVVVVGWQQGQPSKTIPVGAWASSVCIYVYGRVS